MSNAISTEIHDHTLVIKFTRPEIRSPLSVFVLEELRDIIGSAREKALVFTGSEDVFASGADLREISDLTEDTAKNFAELGQGVMQQIADHPRKTIAAVNGYCFGGALDLALACGTRIASPNAVFSHPGANLGIMTGWGGTQRLPRLIGEAKALEMFFTAKRVGADEAMSIGLVDEITDDALARSLVIALNSAVGLSL